MRRFLLLICLCIAGAVQLKSAGTDSVRIALATCYPGSDIYELEGHSALVISRPGYPDMAVTYGMFDFNAPNFVYRFVKGETDYMVGLVDWNRFAESYRRSGRRVVLQPLNLTEEQTERLLERVAYDLEPENSTYRYNYVYDNCATRPLAAIRAAYAPDSLVLAPTGRDSVGAPYSFRDIMREYHKNYPWYQFGIDLALGSGIDRPLMSREQAFCPMDLRSMMAGATVDGKAVTDKEMVVVDIPAGFAVAEPTPWYATPMTVCWGVCILTAIISFFDLLRRRLTRLADTLYYAAAGLAGCLLAFLVFISVHEATSPNVLIWWLNPLCLIPAILIWLKKFKIAVFSYQIVNFVVVLTLMAVSPWLSQSLNAAFYPLMIADLLLAGRYIILNYRNIR